MTSPMDRELRELFEEIASDPTSTLHRIPTGRIEEWAGDPKGLLSPRGDYLSRAEKHLMTAYREEAARVLVQASAAMSLERVPLLRSTSKVPPVEVLERSAARLSLVPGLRPFDGTLDSVRTASASTLAAASLSLVPRDSARICLAVAHFHEGNENAALNTLDQLLASRPSHWNGALAYVNKALVMASRRDYSAALECNQAAALLCPGNHLYATWTITMALQVGDEASFREAAVRLADTDATPEAMRGIGQALLEERRLGKWTPTAESASLIHRLGDTSDDRISSIISAFPNA